ncbi:hypothetical protein D9758_009667 [Tetrapyrgos nigripes]|uniref:Uncharacterized protein n=1 Tax=Tetrapyrgos nigripes TaxID=182062 RepID=A0A8H5CNL9_9AGAR|nr:hypothetical protein D9758_009667 [Tetrapyrgos nigripes]
MVLRNSSYDDRDIDHLKYSDGWFLQGSWNASNIAGSLTGTLASANNLTANVTFTFPEAANAFYYYGIGRSDGGLYAICFDDDCKPPAPKFTRIDGLNRSDNGGNPPHILFSINFDDFGIHTLLLTNQNDTRADSGKSEITLDRFEIQIEDSSVLPSSTSVVQAPASTKESSPRLPIGAIVGIILGVLIALMVVMLMCLRRRAIKHQKRKYASSFLLFNQPSESFRLDIQALCSVTNEDTRVAGNPSHRAAVLTDSESRPPYRSFFLEMGTRWGAVNAGSAVFGSGSEAGYQESESSTLPPNYHHVFRGSR